jgi:signal transduction histidine kinase/ActR/RegA family two-component response regulator
LSVLEASGMGIWVWDVRQDRLRMHESMVKLLGSTHREPSGTSRDLLHDVHPDDVEKVRAALAFLGTNKDAELTYEYRIVSRDSEEQWLCVRSRNECDETGNVTSVMALVLDVTMQKRITAARLHSQKLEALGTLAGGIAHDFNNILQAIMNSSALVAKTIEPSHEAHEYLGTLDMATTRASELVRRILTFGRPSEQHKASIRLDDVVREALTLVRSTLPANIVMRTEFVDPLPSIFADPLQIQQIVINLATNASHAIGAVRGEIKIRLRSSEIASDAHGHDLKLAAGTYAVLEVMDDGCGIPASVLPRIFDPFYTTKPIGQGTGLGLSVVHGIVTSSGGAVTAANLPEGGARFTLYFPAQNAERKLASRPVIRSGQRREARVLLVDDEDLMVILSVQILEDAGFQTLGFSSPHQALQQLLAAPESFDILVTDLCMPELSGFELARLMREQRSELPVLFLSGNVGSEEMAAAARFGTSEILLKPMSVRVLVDAVERALAEAGGPSTSRYA